MAVDFHSLSAGQIMTKSLVCAAPQQDLAEVEAALIEHRISGMPVVEGGRLVGVLSRSDIARVQVLANSLDGQVRDEMDWSGQADGFQHAERPEFRGFRQLLTNLKVKDAMHDQVVTCTADTSVAEVASQMIRQHIHRLIVVDGEKPVGIISSMDLVRLVAQGNSAAASTAKTGTK